jgi:CoA:oxalate CoA-transferase
MSRLLENVRILDLSQYEAGPYATMLLADMGAEVIKIEPPWGEALRGAPPLIGGESVFFMFHNRDKKSMALNLKDQRGVEIFKELTRQADVVFENFTPWVMDSLGIGYETLKEIKPDIIFVSVSGFGQDGPYSKRPSFDLIAQAMSGIISLTGERVGRPVPVADYIGDSVPALYATIAVLAALYHRKATGEGQRVDVAQVDTLFSVLVSSVTFPASGRTAYGTVRAHPTVIYDMYRAKDGYVVICAPMGSVFDRLKGALGLEDVDHEKVERWASERTVEEIVNIMVAAKVPVAPVLDIEESIESVHAKAREIMATVDHPKAGSVKMPNFPLRFSKTPIKIRTPSPTLGQHTEEILSSLLHYSAEQIAKLKEERVI